jgi:DNA recombination protein RmuC
LTQDILLDPVFWLLPAFAAGAGALVAWLWGRSARVRLEERLAAERKHAEEKLQVLTQARGELTHQFKSLSQEILEEKSKRFTEQNRSSLEQILKPLGDKIAGFEKQVRESYEKEGKERSALVQQVKQLEELNRQIADDAINLTKALKGESKTQGNWGEMILETVLERSGLLKGQHYETQFEAASEEGGRRVPDAVIHLPEGRSIVVDSKVARTAYLRLQEAEDEDTRREALKAHLESVRRHLKQLSDKNYHELPQVTTLDYVFMFVPSEAAYVEALRADFSLQRSALENNIAIVSPTTLMPMLRAISNLWRLQSQEQNAAEIARRAGKMYDKFKSFLDDMNKLERGLESASRAFEGAKTKLVSGRGNLVNRAEKLKELGVSAGKRIGGDWRTSAAIEAGEEVDEADEDGSKSQ